MANPLALLLASLSSMVLGFLWYSPFVLGKPWMKQMGLTKQMMQEAKKRMWKTYLASFAGALVQAYVFWQFLRLLALDERDVVFMAGLLWLGFVAVTQLTHRLYSIRKFSWQLLLIDSSYQLISLVIMGLVLWQFM